MFSTLAIRSVIYNTPKKNQFCSQWRKFNVHMTPSSNVFFYFSFQFLDARFSVVSSEQKRWIFWLCETAKIARFTFIFFQMVGHYIKCAETFHSLFIQMEKSEKNDRRTIEFLEFLCRFNASQQCIQRTISLRSRISSLRSIDANA